MLNDELTPDSFAKGKDTVEIQKEEGDFVAENIVVKEVSGDDAILDK